MSTKRRLSNNTETSPKRRKISSKRWVSPFPIKETGTRFAIDSNTKSHPIRAGAKWDHLEQKQLLKLHKSKKYTLTQIANKLGRTQNAVSYRLEQSIKAQKKKQKKVTLSLSPIKSQKRNKMQSSMTSNTLSIKCPKTNSHRNKERMQSMNGFKTFFRQKSKRNKCVKPLITEKMSHFKDLPKLRIHQRNILDTIWTQDSNQRINEKNKSNQSKKNDRELKAEKKENKLENVKPCKYFQTQNGCCRYKSNCKFAHDLSFMDD